MKPFVYYSSLVLALLFLMLAASVWTEVFDQGDFFTNPLVKSAAGWSMTGLMFLGVGLRGWRARARKSGEVNQTTTSKPRT